MEDRDLVRPIPLYGLPLMNFYKNHPPLQRQRLGLFEAGNKSQGKSKICGRQDQQNLSIEDKVTQLQFVSLKLKFCSSFRGPWVTIS